MDQDSLGAVGNFDVDFNPLKMVYIVSKYSQSLILPCSWNLNVTNVEMKLEIRNNNEGWNSFTLDESLQVDRWTSVDNFNGLQKRILQSDAGKYYICRCSARLSTSKSNDNTIDHSPAFVIAVESNYKIKLINNVC